MKKEVLAFFTFLLFLGISLNAETDNGFRSEASNRIAPTLFYGLLCFR